MTKAKIENRVEPIGGGEEVGRGAKNRKGWKIFAKENWQDLGFVMNSYSSLTWATKLIGPISTKLGTSRGMGTSSEFLFEYFSCEIF